MSDNERGARVLPLRSSASGIYDDDAALARALIDRRPEAPAALWTRFAPMVHRMLRRTLGPGTDVEDVVQDVFLCVFQKVSGLREPRALRAFVISVTALTARYELRRRWVGRWVRLGRDPDRPEVRVFNPDPEAREALVRFYKILDRVKPADRTAFVLRFIEGLELAEVAAAMHTSLATAKRRIARVWARVSLLVERDPSLAHYLKKELTP
jgi:RNA polymerase sigma-70 factor (ECF subfamily)